MKHPGRLPLTIVVAVAAIVIVIVLARVVQRLRAGNALATSLLTGQFDTSSVGQQFTHWFGERPIRAEQRAMFVQVCLALGAPRGAVADRLMSCIMKVWGGHALQFGDILAEELERAVTCDAPNGPANTQARVQGVEALRQVTARLRALDAP